jgi:hypothetical protein
MKFHGAAPPFALIAEERIVMKPGKWLIAAVIGVAALQAGLACADEPQQISKAQNKADFDLVVAAVKQEMATGGRYEFVQGKDLDTVNQRLGEMSSLFDRYGSVDQMDQATKVTLFNDQELIDGILTKDDRNRSVCVRETTLGSNIPHVTCRTYGEIRQNQRDTQDWFRQQHLQMQMNELGGSKMTGQRGGGH